MPPVDHVRHHRAPQPLSAEPGTPGDLLHQYQATGQAGGPMDHVRKQKARHEFRTAHGGHDGLLKGQLQRINLGKYLPSQRKERAKAIVMTLAMAPLCMISYITMILLWFLVYRDSLLVLVTVFILLLSAGWLMCIASKKSILNMERPWLWWMGVLFGQAAVVGLVVGFFLYFRLLCYYFQFQEMRTYTNVAASQSAKAFKDGSMILFTEDSRIDAQRAIGFRSKWTGQFYCVAPIVNGAMGDGRHDINYWAVGENCCAARAEFLCDDASDFSTRSGLVLLQPEDIVRPFMSWAVKGGTYPYYKDAIRLQEATYSTKAVSEPTLLRWTKDPEALKQSYYTAAVRICRVFSIIYFVCLLVFTYFLAWWIQPKKRLEGIIGQET